MRKLGTIVAIGAGIITIFGGAWTMDSRWSQAAEVKQLKEIIVVMNDRLESKIVSDQIDSTQSRLWKLKDRHGEDVTKFPQSAKEEYRSLEKKKEELSKELDALKTKKGD